MKKILFAVLIALFPITVSWASVQWEKQGNFYFLAKNDRRIFSRACAGANKFGTKDVKYEGVDFLVRGQEGWKDYGRVDLTGDNLFSLPIKPGVKIEELHFLAGGNYGNSYKNDKLLSLYGDNYFYAVLTVIFSYENGTYKSRSVPVFWDWFHLGQREWAKDGARIKNVGNNPVRKDCSMYHISFSNPLPEEPLKDIIITDSWISDFPFSEVFAITIKSGDTFASAAKEDKQYPISVNSVAKQTPDTKTEWLFDKGFDGWISGSSQNWDANVDWQADAYQRKGVVSIPACNWGGDKFSWIEKKISLPDWGSIKLQFLRHSLVYSELVKRWSDGLLKVIIMASGANDVVYEKVYSADWQLESADISRYAGKVVVVRFENHAGGNVSLSETTSPLCDGEDALVDDIKLIGVK